MKSFKAFHLDTANHILERDGERVPIAPKAFDVLAYLVEHAGRLVTQDEILEALWSETYVNPEVLRKYILEIRKALGDRRDKPEFIETLPKRGYRFIAPVVDESTVELPDLPITPVIKERAVEATIGFPTGRLGQRSPSYKRHLWKFLIPLVVAAVTTAGYFRIVRQRASAASRNSIAVLPFRI